MVSLTWAVGVALGLAPAGPRTVQFEWDAPEQCPEAAEVTAMVEKRLGAPIEHAGTARLEVLARVRRGADAGWELRLWFITDEGTKRRDLADDDCGVLADAVATLVAVQLDPTLAPKEDPAVDDPEPKAQPRPTPPPIVEPTPPPPPPAPSPLDLDLVVGGGVAAGLLPGAAGGFRLGLALSWKYARLQVDGQGWYAPPLAIEGTDDARARFGLGLGGVRGGFLYQWPKAELATVAGLEVGAIRGRGTDLTQSNNGLGLMAAVTLGPTVAYYPVPRIGLFLGVEGFWMFVRPRFEVEGPGLVFQPWPVGIRATAGLRWRFFSRGHDARGVPATKG